MSAQDFNIIRSYMEQYGIKTRCEVARILGVGESAVRFWLKGERSVPLYIIKQLENDLYSVIEFYQSKLVMGIRLEKISYTLPEKGHKEGYRVVCSERMSRVQSLKAVSLIMDLAIKDGFIASDLETADLKWVVERG